MSFTRTYLHFYNKIQIFLWVLVLCAAFMKFTLKKNVDIRLFIGVQSLMIFDIINAALKLVPGNLFATTIQIASRLFISWRILPTANSDINLILLFIAWGVTEVVRYSYYENTTNSVLRYLRYSTFILLYPLGVLGGELPLTYYHYSSNTNYFDLAFMLANIPFFPYLYGHMLKLRKNKLKKDKKE